MFLLLQKYIVKPCKKIEIDLCVNTHEMVNKQIKHTYLLSICYYLYSPSKTGLCRNPAQSLLDHIK